MNLEDAIRIAKEVRKNSYDPYTNYLVGAALVTKSGKIYSGCNIENEGLLGICAERTAFVKALSEGENDFDYIVVCGGPSLEQIDNNCTPCGYCRQFMHEFVDENFKIYAVRDNSEPEVFSINDLLPHSFKLEN